MAVSIDYRAPAECPGRPAFLEEVLRRLTHVRVVEDGAAERRFAVELESASHESRARLSFVDADSRPVRREISARDCDEAMSGIALITALAIDPRLSIDAPHHEDEAETESVSEPEAPELEPAVRSTPKTESPVLTGSRDVHDVRDRAVPNTSHSAWYWGLGAAVGAVSGVAPSVSPSGVLFAELGTAQVRARFGFGYADSGSLDVKGRDARFRLAQGAAGLCPFAATVGSIVLRPCAALELGWLHAAGLESELVEVAKTSSGLWFAGLAALRAELALVSSFALSLEGQLRVPLLRRSYVFEQPELLAYETPRFAGGVLLGAEARFE